MTRRSTIILLATLLMGCQSSGIPSGFVDSKSTEAESQCDFSLSYCVEFNKIMNEREWTDNWTGLSGQSTDHTVSNGLDSEDPDYIRADFYSSTNCSPFITGASKTVELPEAGGKTKWGKVDAFDQMQHGPDTTKTLCRPPNMKWTVSRTGSVILHSSAYALCSEKDGKTVVICIGQMTDNPTLAEQIFETFRWTE